MRIAIISAWDDNYNELAKVTIPNRHEYAKKHGYESIETRNWTGDRKSCWAKIDFARRELVNYDALFVMDVDAIITNSYCSLDWLIKTSRDLSATKDINGFNSGMLIIKNTVWSHDFLRRYWEAGTRYEHHVNPDQTCMAHMLICEAQQHWQVIPQNRFNSFRYQLYGVSYPEGQWQEGHFILHLPAISNEKRIEVFNEYFSSHR